MSPLSSEETGIFFSFCIKVAGWFLSFVGGIVTATWVVASKVKGFDDRLRSVESSQANCQSKIIGKIDAKLDRLHERIDDILLVNGQHQRIEDTMLSINKEEIDEGVSRNKEENDRT